MKKHPFTLIEILIVLIVVGLVLAVATPRLMRESDRMTVENSLTAIRTAVNETAMRSRATGHALTLTIAPDEHCFMVDASDENLERTWTPPSRDNGEGGGDNKAAFIRARDHYDFPDDIQWTPDSAALDDDGNVVFTFFPDGQAAAREITFTVCGKNFVLQIDRITANPVILELLD